MSEQATLREWLEVEPFALCMSSGFFGFFAHAGALKALEEAGLEPARVAGSSAGALVAGMWAAGLSAEELCTELLALERREFWDPAPGLGLLRGRKFRARLERAVGRIGFDDCRVPVAVSVFDIAARQTKVLRDGDLASAIVASCAFPVLFQPVWREGRLYSDGGILDRHGTEGLHSGERVLHHHLVSRSPWRRRGSSALRPPHGERLVALVLPDLPRSGPFKLARGREAMDQAYRRTLASLNRPVGPTVEG
jgi:NTE family protein